ncbi:MAG TPA: type III-A CRISPR-associated protein Csm2 [Methanothrix sp.]|nr:type III-A CRISPR-associated protein Csm2 [Methanothrix sp.]HOL44645.1 type III-A CRISPR-associated protein Csm2 [Methanothrix sp.]
MTDVSSQIKMRIGRLESFDKYRGDELVQDAERIAGSIKDLKTAQLRRIYGEVKRMEMDFEKSGEFSRDRVVLLKPRLAYAANKMGEVKPIADIFSACIDKIHDRDDFMRFVNFFEAILAYHKKKR